jgi:hypothetical protein
MFLTAVALNSVSHQGPIQALGQQLNGNQSLFPQRILCSSGLNTRRAPKEYPPLMANISGDVTEQSLRVILLFLQRCWSLMTMAERGIKG